MNINISEKSNFIWKIADILRGDFKQSEYGDIILPFTVLCRLDSVLAPTKDAVMEIHRKSKYKTEYARLAVFKSITGGLKFYNLSEFTFAKLKDDAANIADNLTDYIKGFSENARSILESFDIYSQIARLDKADLLYLVVTKFVDDIDLHPDHVSNNEMGYIFEELIRKFSEMSNETAGEHFTPREVIRLMVSMLFNPDLDKIIEPSYMAKLYDPAAGTGGMLSAGIEYAKEHSPTAMIEVYGQELNEKTYAICKSDTMIKGKGYENIHLGNSFTHDALPRETFHYMLCNPPFGVEWKKYEKFIRGEAVHKGEAGRFGAGLPRVSDGSLLFLQHMIKKMMPVEDGGSRIAIVFNGSPLFTGDAGSGESEIRRWIIENGWLETIIALPDQLFYNTGILTYVWIVTNRKNRMRKGKIQLIDGTSFFERMRKPFGEKRKLISEDQIKQLTEIYGVGDNLAAGEEGKYASYMKIFDEDDFGYWKVTVERPLRLNFQASADRIERIREQIVFVNLATSKKSRATEHDAEVAHGKKQQETILAAVGTIDGGRIYKNRAEFQELVSKAFKKAELDVKTPLLKAILAALAEKDESADICVDSNGNPEPDTDLRDTEQIPLKEDIAAYIEREVLPYAQDAWVDERKTQKGYEIPFKRHFYKYTELGDAAKTMRDIQSLGAKIHTAITKLSGEV
jgi:type I restriction enzyme M protein